MDEHRKIYFNFFGYNQQDYFPSELSGTPADEIHHIDPRGMGGSELRNNIRNLIGLASREHRRAEGVEEPKISQEDIQEAHDQFIIFFLTQNPEKFSLLNDEEKDFFRPLVSL